MFEHIRPHDRSHNESNGRRWTSSKPFRPCLHLYLVMSNCDPIDQKAS